MTLVSLLSPLLSLVAVAAFIWLVVVAFKRSVLWGLLVLFLSPITAIVFAIKFWQESKKPFLAYIGSSVVSFALIIYAVSAMGGLAMMGMAGRMATSDVSEEEAAQFMVEQLERMERNGRLSAEEKRELQRMKQELQQMQQQGAQPEPQPTIALGRSSSSVPTSPSYQPSVSRAPSTKPDSRIGLGAPLPQLGE